MIKTIIDTNINQISFVTSKSSDQSPEGNKSSVSYLNWDISEIINLIFNLMMYQIDMSLNLDHFKE